MDFEYNYFPSEACLMSEPQGEVRDFFKCYPEDFDVAQEITRVSEGQELETNQFAFFDLKLSDHDKYHLEQVKPYLRDSGLVVDMFTYADDIHYRTMDVLGSLSSKISVDSKYHVANLIAKFVSLIVASSEHMEAEVIIMTHNENNEAFIDRHIDKSHVDMLVSNLNLTATIFSSEQSFLLPLIGESTIFFSVNSAQKVEFSKLTYETFSTWGEYNSPYPEEINALFRGNKIYSPELGFGSIHFSGSNGTVHAKPYIHGERLVIKVVPNVGALLHEFNRIVKG